MSDRIYGARRSPEGSRGTRELQHLPGMRRAHAIAGATKATNNRQTIVEILDQGGLGSCELNATAQHWRMDQVRTLALALAASTGITFEAAVIEVKKLPPELISRLFAYMGAQACGGYLGRGDTGTCTYDVAQAAATIGFMRESEYPYSDDESRIDPGTKLEACKRLAWDQRTSATVRVDADSMPVDACQAECSKAIRAGYSIIHASDFTEKAENLMPGEIWYPSTDHSEVMGGHAYLVVDEGPAKELCPYSDSNELAWLCANSWGSTWCFGGLFLVNPPSFVAKRYDDWIFTQAPLDSGTV